MLKKSSKSIISIFMCFLFLFVSFSSQLVFAAKIYPIHKKWPGIGEVLEYKSNKFESNFSGYGKMTMNATSYDIHLDVARKSNGKFDLIIRTTNPKITIRSATVKIGNSPSTYYKRFNETTVKIRNIDLKPNTNADISVYIPMEKYNSIFQLTSTTIKNFYVHFTVNTK